MEAIYTYIPGSDMTRGLAVVTVCGCCNVPPSPTDCDRNSNQRDITHTHTHTHTPCIQWLDSDTVCVGGRHIQNMEGFVLNIIVRNCDEYKALWQEK